MKNVIQKYDKLIGALFFMLTIAFIVLSMTNETFFNWAYERHQNQMSWFIRPIFLIPFCFFAYKRSWTGVFATVFLLLTSMFWFSKPEAVSEQVQAFLQFEKEWLSADWDYKKLLLTLTIPVSFFALGFAFWKRSLLFGIAVMVLMATGKMVWSVYYVGEAGKSIFVPATIGLVLCVVLVFYGFKKLDKK